MVKLCMRGDKVIFPHYGTNEVLTVVFIGDGDDMDWAADKEDGTPDSWLHSTCKVVS